MTKYEFLKERLTVVVGVAAGGAAMAFFMCILPWGSYGWMAGLDYRKLSNEKASEYFIDLTLDKDIIIQTSFGNMKAQKGEKIKYLAWYEKLPEREGPSGCLVQTEDGQRGFCDPSFLRSMTEGNPLYVYDHSRNGDIIKFHSLVYKDDIVRLIQEKTSFEDFDNRYGPALNVVRDSNTGNYKAKYSGVDYSYDGYIRHGMLATFSKGHLVSVEETGPNDSWLFNFLAPYADNWMKHSVAYFSPGYYMKYKGYGPLQTSFYPYKWLARGIMGMLDILFAFLVMALICSIVIIKFADNKDIDNSSLQGLIFIPCALIYTPYCYYTMEFSPNLFCFIVTTLPMMMMCLDFENRCPHCHSLVHREVLDRQYGRVETKVYESDSSKDHLVGEREVERLSRKWVDEKVVDRVYETHRMEEHHRKVKTKYRCPACGYTYEDTTDENLGTTHKKWVSGVDRITTTTTTEI